MNMYWIYDIPNWQFCLLTITVFVAVSLLGFWAVRPVVKWIVKDSGEYNDVVSWMFAGVGVLYGLTLGLIAVGTWSNFSTASATTSKEADAIEALYRDFDGYPTVLRVELEGMLRNYVETVINKEWPAHRQGQVLDLGDVLLEELENKVMAIEPTSETMKIAHGEAIRSLNQLVQDRGERLQAVSTALPGVLWAIVLLGSVANIAMTYLFWVENRRLHAVLVAFLSATLAMLIFLTAAMDNPFRGEFSVGTDPYQYILDHIIAPTQLKG